MKKYSLYKETDVEFIGSIPEYWTLKKIGFLSEIQGRIGFKGYSVSDLVKSGEGALTIGAKHISKNNQLDFSDPEYISWEKYYESPEIMIEKGHLLVVQRGSLGKIAIVDTEIGEATINPSILILKQVSIHKNFLFYFLSSKAFKGFIEIINTATAVPMISQQQLGDFKISLPPEFSEQTQIANFLDYKTGQIDRLIEQKVNLLKLLAEKRTAIITRAVTKGLNPSVEMKDSGIDWLGKIPKHWEVWKVTHGINKIGSGTTPKSDNPEYYNGEILWVTTSELRERPIYDTKQKVTELALQDYNLRFYTPGAVIIAMYGATIGRLGILLTEATVNQACCVFDEPIKFDSMFLYYWLWMARNTLISFSTGGGQPNLSQDDLKKLRIPCPEIYEQKEIASYIEKSISKILALEDKIELSVTQLKEYREALITAAVTGQIDVRKEANP